MKNSKVQKASCLLKRPTYFDGAMTHYVNVKVEVNVLAIVNGWAMVSESGRNQPPFVVPVKSFIKRKV